MRLAELFPRRIADQTRAVALEILADPPRRWRALARLGVGLIFASALYTLFAPFFRETSLYGFRDWDDGSSRRYLTVVSLLRYHELPWWNPSWCGGFPAWGHPETANNLVSPYLPLYLAFPIQVAERLEIVFATLTALVFTYLLAGRVTKSASLRALVAIAYAMNGRWIMQIAEGHMWHTQYAWLPLALFFLDVSLEPGKLRWSVYAGVVLAMTAYMGGIYPLPHTALVFVLYAGMLTIAGRTARPFVSVAIAGAVGVGLAAPKLLAVADMMRLYPRKIDSPEALGLGQLLSTFIDGRGTIEHDPIPMPSWGWYEYGIYVGAWITIAMMIGVLGPSASGRGNALRFVGLVFLILGCGSFHPDAPWTLLHKLPSFSSQHVPSRFLMPAVLLLMLAFAALAGRGLDRALANRGWIDLVLLVPVYFIAADVAAVGLQSSSTFFIFKAPVIEPSAEFHHVTDLPYKYDPDWRQVGRQQLLAMFANTGVIRCYGAPSELVTGAIAQATPGYRGEAYLVGAPGAGAATARVTDWSPNTATVRYEGAAPGTTLVYNMNYDASWRADGRPAESYRGAVATRVTSSAGEVAFRYYPRTLNWGLFICFVTALAAFITPRRWRAWRARGYSLRPMSLKPAKSPSE
jgi:hypothetical protein